MFVKNNKLRDDRDEQDSVFLWNSNNSEFKRSSYERDFYYESYNRLKNTLFLNRAYRMLYSTMNK